MSRPVEDSDRTDGSTPDDVAETPEERTAAQALLAQMGGVSGLIYSALPVAVLVPVNTAFGLVSAISAALGVAA